MATVPVQAASAAPAPAPRVVADQLNNPRQLNLAEDGRTLVVAEAGRGGEGCAPPDDGPPAPCVGPTGSITRVTAPQADQPDAERTISGLPSSAAPNGAFAVGTNGADEVAGGEGLHIVAQSPGLAAEPTAEDSDQGLYLAADATDQPPMEPDEPPLPGLVTLPGGDIALLGADLEAAERRLNPDGAQIESNPYAVVFVDQDSANPEDGFALVADAAANAVWKVSPNHESENPEELLAVSVFAAFPTTEEAEGQQGPPEFVPTSLALHGRHVFVGGLGSEATGAAQVVQFDVMTGAEVRRFTGFTGITGVAVDETHLYVSQLFGAVPPGPPGDEPSDEAPTTPPPGVPGSVVKTSRASADAPRFSVDVPFPAGISSDGQGNVYVAVNSIAPAEGVEGIFGPGSFDVGGGAVWDIDFTGAPMIEPTPYAPPLEQLAGGDRYATAARIAQETFDAAPTVVLASGAARNFADALTGNYLAGAEDAPILLTEPGSLPAATQSALTALGSDRVVIVGGPTAVSTAVEEQLALLGYDVDRLGGADRYATAAMVASEVGDSAAEVPVGELDGQRTAILGNGQDFPDILAAGPISYAEQFPIMITRPGSLPAATRAVLQNLEIERVIIVGGPAAVSARVQRELEGVVDDVDRIGGTTRFSTAVLLAEFAYDVLDFDDAHIELARSDDFADALAGGAHAGTHRAPIVLTLPAALHPVTRDFIAARSGTLTSGHSFGGPEAVSDAARIAAGNAVAGQG